MIAERVEAEQVDAVAADLHPGDERDAGQDDGDHRPAHERRDRVAGDDPAPLRRGHEQAAREAALEVARDPEACEDAAERGRLQEHEDELERRVAAVEVEAGHVAKPGEPAGERHEVHQREEHRRDEQRRVLEQHRHLPVREPERDVHRAPHVRAILTFSCRPASPSETAISASVNPNPSRSACTSQPLITSERSPSIM